MNDTGYWTPAAMGCEQRSTIHLQLRLSPLDVDIEGAESRRIVDEEEPARADLANGTVIEVDALGDHMVGTPGPAAVEAEHDARRRAAVAAREHAVAHQHHIGGDLADFEGKGFSPGFAIVAEDLGHLRRLRATDDGGHFWRRK